MKYLVDPKTLLFTCFLSLGFACDDQEPATGIDGGQDLGSVDDTIDFLNPTDAGSSDLGNNDSGKTEDIGRDTNVEPEELKAFPSALGDGAYTTGGRGGIVVHVTNLNDSGPGSLREALGMTEKRTIVFDVSGVITLESVLGMDESNGDVTIAGQSAPEGGITIDGNRLYVLNVRNMIVRHIRFKGGATISNDAISVTGDILDQIWDHCSFGFGTDEGASWYSVSAGGDQNRITVQRSLWNENSKGSILGKEESQDGVPSSGSFISNLFYNSGYRFPNLASPGVGQFDIINNVSWNISNRLIRGNGAFNLNRIGNYYNYGTRGIRDVRTNVFRFGTIPQIYNFENKIVGGGSNPLTHSVEEMNVDSDRSWGFFQHGEEVQAGSFVVGEDYTIPAASEWGTTDYTAAGAASNTEDFSLQRTQVRVAVMPTTGITVSDSRLIISAKLNTHF